MNTVRKEFGQIYDKSVDKIYRFIYIKVDSKDVAEDLTSETFTKAWKAFNASYEKEKPIENPEAFCYRTARNLVIDYYKYNAKRQAVSIDSIQLVDNKPGIEERAMINSEMEQVKKAIQELKDDYQDVIIMRYLDEMSVPEIADILGKSEESVRVTTHRAMGALRKVLEA